MNDKLDKLYENAIFVIEKEKAERTKEQEKQKQKERKDKEKIEKTDPEKMLDKFFEDKFTVEMNNVAHTATMDVEGAVTGATAA